MSFDTTRFGIEGLTLPVGLAVGDGLAVAEGDGCWVGLPEGAGVALTAEVGVGSLVGGTVPEATANAVGGIDWTALVGRVD